MMSILPVNKSTFQIQRFSMTLYILSLHRGNGKKWGHPTPRQGTAVPWNPAYNFCVPFTRCYTVFNERNEPEIGDRCHLSIRQILPCTTIFLSQISPRYH